MSGSLSGADRPVSLPALPAATMLMSAAEMDENSLRRRCFGVAPQVAQTNM